MNCRLRGLLAITLAICIILSPSSPQAQAFEISITRSDVASLGSAPNSKETCDSFDHQGQTLYYTGDYEGALSVFEQAKICYQNANDPAGEGMVLSNIGSVYFSQGRYTEALMEFETALELLRDIGDHYGEAITINNIGQVHHAQGSYTEALQQYLVALELLRDEGDRTAEARTYINMGGVYEAQGRLEDALAYNELALTILHEVGDLSGEAVARGNIGLIYLSQGLTDEAVNYTTTAIVISRLIGDRAGEATMLNNLGGIHETQNQHKEALAAYEAALALRRELGDRFGEGKTLDNIGSVYNNQLLYSEAMDKYKAALQVAREIGDRAGEASALNNLGVVYAAQGLYTEALAQVETALEIVRMEGDPTSEGIALSNIGGVYEDQARYPDALLKYQQAINLIEGTRVMAGNAMARAGFINRFADMYDQLIRLQFQQGQVANAFVVSEQGRARSFLDSLVTRQIDLFDNIGTNLLTRESEAYAVRQSARNAVAQAKAINSSDVQLIAALERQLSVAESAYSEAISAIKERKDQLADLVPGRNRNVLSLVAVQHQLDDQTTLVSYWMLDDRTIAFVTTADDFTQIELPDATTEQVSAALQNLYQWRNREQPHPLPLRNLYHWLVEPLMEHLQTPHVAIVPHQLLHYVPFAALTDGQTYFGEQHTLSILPSVSVLPFLNENVHDGQFTGTPTTVVLGNPKTALAALPYAEAEAKAVADLIGATVYTGTHASELQLRAVVSGANILHLAAHGDYNLANPLYSAIALAADDEQDGLLETHEIFGLPLRGNDLVVLSACQTSLNELKESSAVAVSRGDEIVGLTRAFFFAGAPTVISSLWSVNDDATEALMVAFYKYWLKEGMSKAEALQAAQADVRADPRWVSPFYWAGFVLNGHPGKAVRKVTSYDFV